MKKLKILFLVVLFAVSFDGVANSNILLWEMNVKTSPTPVVVMTEEINLPGGDVLWVSTVLSRVSAEDFITALMKKFDKEFGYGKSSLGRDVFLPDVGVMQGVSFVETVVLTPCNVQTPQYILSNMKSGLDFILLGVENISGVIFAQQVFIINSSQ